MLFFLKPLYRRVLVDYVTSPPTKKAEEKKKRKKKPLIILPDRREQENRDYEDLTFLAIMDFI